MKRTYRLLNLPKVARLHSPSVVLTGVIVRPVSTSTGFYVSAEIKRETELFLRELREREYEPT